MKRGLGGMARHNSLLRASEESAPLEPAFAGLMRHDLRELRPDAHSSNTSRLGVGDALDLLDDSPTVRLEDLDLATDDPLATDRVAAVPASKTKVSNAGLIGLSSAGL